MLKNPTITRKVCSEIQIQWWESTGYQYKERNREGISLA